MVIPGCGYLTLKSNESFREFRVHRTILAARSSVFREMLFPESADSGSGEMECDVSEEALEQVIQFIYTGQITAKLPNIQSICLAADKFGLDRLMDLICTRLRANNFEEEEVADLFIISHLQSQEKLFYIAMERLRLKKVNLNNVIVEKKLTEYPKLLYKITTSLNNFQFH